MLSFRIFNPHDKHFYTYEYSNGTFNVLKKELPKDKDEKDKNFNYKREGKNDNAYP
jgi:hypothetical protein